MVKNFIIIIGNLRWESVGDEAPEPEERDMVSVHRANLGYRDRIDDVDVDADDDDDAEEEEEDVDDCGEKYILAGLPLLVLLQIMMTKFT